MSEKIKEEMNRVNKPREVTSFRIHPVLKKHLSRTAIKNKTTIGKLIEAYIIYGLTQDL